MNILFFGDIFARPGREALARVLPSLKEHYRPDLILCNGENLAHGAGATEKIVQEVLAMGVDVITSGNHVFDKKEIADFMDRENAPLIRPLNFENGSPGKGFCVVEKKSAKVLVLNLIGQVFMKRDYRNPFLVAEEFLKTVPDDIRIILVDFHADATSEKKAMGVFLDGKVSAVLGTHTHIPTADEQILPGKTAYIGDVGMTGAADSVIGMDTRIVIAMFRGEKVKMDIADSRNAEINAVFLVIDEQSGKAISLQRIRILEEA